MIATITAQSSTMMMDHPFLRNANLAGAPLPHIPRRSASTSRMPLPAFSTSPTFPASPVSISVQNPTPPDSQEKVQKTSSVTVVDEDYSSEASTSSSSSSSSSTKLFLRPRRAVVPPLALSPPPSSSPVPIKARKESKVRTRSPPTDNESDTPRAAPSVTAARLQFDSPKQRHFSESRIADPGFKSAPAMTPPMVRKKSGQIVKSSLKLSRSAPRPGLSVFTGISSSKSEPNTPSLSKAVHFDKQLEHVKLFLAEQKPLAVSRDGSPTDDTSGTDSDFPSFIFGEPYGDKVSRQRLVMNVINMPSVVNLQADLVLETLLLSNDGTNIQGRARVRNLAFQKWLAVRFTFDAWQTTSEVTAKYVESCPDNFDVFGFTIKLNDLLARIEEKTLVLALRYSIVGREIWDNNHGRNYVAKFSRVKAAVPNRSRPIASDSGSDMMDLKTKLEKVVQKRDSAESAPRLTRPMPLSVKEPVLDEPIAHHVEATLSFDPSNSPKATRKSIPNDTRSRTFTYPSVSSSPVPSPPSSIPWPTKQPPQLDASKSKALGSPRDLDDFTFRPSPFVPADLEERPFAVTRNHQRGYFDIGVLPVSTLKRTPPGTPRMRSADSSTPAPRSYSFPPVDMPFFGLMLSRDVEGTTSDESTPSIVSPSSGSDQDSSPAQSPMELEYAEPMEKMPDTPNTNYHQFLNRFCFYTGTDSLEVSPDLSRSSSMSSIDDVLSASPRLPAFLQHHLSTLTPRGDTGTVTPTNKQPSAVL